MQLWFWIWLGLVLKMPVLWLCWFVYKAINDTPVHVLDDDDGGQPVEVVYGQGPRNRGPSGGLSNSTAGQRRRDPGHDEASKKRSGVHA